MEACESQHQLHGDGLHHVAKEKSMLEILSNNLKHRSVNTDSPDCLPILLNISVFLLFLFFHFLGVDSVR